MARRKDGSGRGGLAAMLGGAAAALLALAGCDQSRIEKLEEGVSTEADVRRELGTPAAVFEEQGGARTLDYPRQPEGTSNYLVTIGPDGVMTSLRQVLRPASFARVRPGMDGEEVRRLLGKPGRIDRYSLKRQEEWFWRWADEGTVKEFGVLFGDDGRVLSSAVGPDTKNTRH